MKREWFIKTLTNTFLILLSANLSSQELILEGISHPITDKSENVKLANGLKEVFQDWKMKESKSNFLSHPKYLAKQFSIDEEYLLIECLAKKNTASLIQELENLNFEVINSYGKNISGRIHLDDLERLAKLKELQYARPIYTPLRRVGSVHSQGDTAQYTDLAREDYSLDGNSFTIGVLSDSYDNLNGASSGILSGDLPGASNPNGYTTEVTVLKDLASGGSDEARAMVEIIHDVSPAAEILARTAFEGEADFAQGILDLRTAGADVIVDDIGYFAEPFFQDGIIAQAVDEVVDDGAVYFSAAGNSGRKSYEVDGFNDSGFTLSGKPIHNFNTGGGSVDYTQSLSIPAGVTMVLTFQWDDPFGTLPNSVASANTDMDIHLYNSNLTANLASGTDDNISTGDPLEIISYTNNTGSAEAVNLVIQHYSGPVPDKMKYVIWSDAVTIQENDTKSSTVTGHANASGAIAVGAASYYNTEAYGASPASINGFSSAGGTPILFDKVGNSIAEEIRLKPEMVAPDNANTTFFGWDIAQDSDNHPNFPGTSAAAPHLAGLGVLLLEMGASNRTEVLDAMITTAADLDDPNTAEADLGFDFSTGYGMVQGRQAIAHIASLPVELMEFSVKKIRTNNAYVQWATASEFNNKEFIIQHKTDSKAFYEIGKVEGKGSVQQRSDYGFLVENLKPGIHYFQLLQKDIDGKKVELGVETIEIKSTDNSVYTFSKEGQQSFIVHSPRSNEIEIQVYNSIGKEVLRKSKKINSEETSEIQFDVSNWMKGTYFYKVGFKNNSNVELLSGKFAR